MSDNYYTLAVIVGLAAGIGFITLFALMFFSPNSAVTADEQEEEEYVTLSIEGLKSTYSPGEPIVFTVRAQGVSDGGIACNSFSPLVVIRDDDSGEETVLNPIRAKRSLACIETVEFDREFVFGEKEEIVSERAGSYTVTASYKANTAITSHEDIMIEEKYVIG